MNISSLARRTVTVAALVPLVALGLSSAPAQAAQTADGELAATWLADQLTDDGVVVDEAFGFADLGLTLDVFFALDELDAEPDARAAIVDALEADPGAYVSGGEFAPTDRYAGSLGKLASAVQAAGQDPTAFGGWDLIAELEARVQPDGRATDVSEYGEFSNAVGQNWVVRALAQADSELADETATYLVQQQCADGGFRVTLPQGSGDPGCVSDTDATAFAVEALQVAQDNGVGTYDVQIDKALDQLVGTQAADGSWVNGDGNASANSTGVAADVLDDQGRSREALKAAKWIHGVFVSTAAAVGPLAGEAGAIAFGPADLTTATKNGITVPVRAKWVRASAQAATALDLVSSAHLFADVPASATFFEQITWLAGSGITTGYADDTFRPSQPVLREQVAAFYYRAAGATYVHTGAPTFSDVPPTHVFYDEIEWFADQGITTGYVDGTFRGSQPVLREQVAAFFYRYLDADETATGAPRFTDVPPTATFYDEIEWFASTGITTGYADGTFRGSQPVLREQIAAFFFRLPA